MLLNWHNQDPVSAFEIARNNAIYARQNNRNPFIDNPQYVNQIWGSTPGGTTTGGGTTSTATAELYFSEYVEGSSNNKALEITNATGSSINLSGYAVKKQTNGAGSWSSGLNLTGTLSNNGKFVIVNSSIASTCYNKATANIATTASEMTFNGNDAIGLFKNGTLIDIIGNFNGGSANFASEETLRRKTTVTVPKTSFNKTSDWSVYAADTCSGIGNRTSNDKETALQVSEINFEMYPNPSNGSITITTKNNTKSVSIEIYSILGSKVYSQSKTNQEMIEINSLESGLYIVKIFDESKSISKKLIVN
jgi:hypothetical protein